MVAPRLLDKRTVNAEVATQRAQTIKQGLDLAKKVDVLRETKLEEEGNLERFRTDTIQKVQQQIDEKISERDILERGNTILREDRIRLSAPIDLSQAWEEVKLGRTENTEWREKLTEQSIAQLAKESDLEDLTSELRKERAEIDRAARLTEQTLSEAETKFTQASDTFERAERESEKMLADARSKENHLRIREQEATDREISLSKEENRIQKWEIDLSSREKKLRSSQEIFIRAQNYIKNKK